MTETSPLEIAVEETELSIEEIFRREVVPVMRDVMNIIGDRERAKEITQDAFAELFVHWRKVSKYEKPGAWVRRIAIRKAVKARVPAESVLVDSETVTPNVDVMIDVRRAIARLALKERAAVVLHYYHDLSSNEIADILKCKEATARVHLYHARQSLREILEGEGYK